MLLVPGETWNRHSSTGFHCPMGAVSTWMEVLGKLLKLLDTHAPPVPQVTGNCTCPAGKYADKANNCADW